MSCQHLTRYRIVTSSLFVGLMVAIFFVGWQIGRSDQSVAPISDAEAAGGLINGPNVTALDRYVYYPGTEVLARDEIRVIACGTGMSDQRIEYRAFSGPLFMAPNPLYSRP